MALARLFVAVWPDDATCEDLRRLHRKPRPGVRFVPPENWHVTLRFVGQGNPAELAAALVDVAVTPATVRLGPVVDLLSNHSVVVPADGLSEWAAAVNRATRGLGDAAIRRRFVGHLTLARLNARVRRDPALLPDVVGTPFSASFTASEFTLVASHLDPSGARYEVLDTFPAWP